VRSHLRTIIERTSPQGIAGALRGMGLRSDSTDLLPTIQVPTLVVCGQDDALTPLAEMKTMHDALPNSQFVEISGAGHIANQEQPDAFTKALQTFLTTLEDA
jgi:pimeloyl-ACP methyl ester carboxylesterase